MTFLLVRFNSFLLQLWTQRQLGITRIWNMKDKIFDLEKLRFFKIIYSLYGHVGNFS